MKKPENMVYFKLYTDWMEVTCELNYEEKGRLVDAIVSYLNGEDTSPYLTGSERFVFPAYRMQLERNAEELERENRNKSKAGKMGAAARWGPKEGSQDSQDDGTAISEMANDSTAISEMAEMAKTKGKRQKTKDEGKGKDKDEGITKDGGNTWDIPARETPDTLELYALRAFPHMTPNNVSEMVSYLDSLPEELIRYAVDKTAEQGVTAYSYCRTILNRYVADGIHSVAEAREKDAEYERRRKAQAAKPAPVTENPLDHAKFY